MVWCKDLKACEKVLTMVLNIDMHKLVECLKSILNSLKFIVLRYAYYWLEWNAHLINEKN